MNYGAGLSSIFERLNKRVSHTTVVLLPRAGDPHHVVGWCELGSARSLPPTLLAHAMLYTLHIV